MFTEIIFLVPEIMSQNFWIFWAFILTFLGVLFLIIIYIFVLYQQQKKIKKNIFSQIEASQEVEGENFSKIYMPQNTHLKKFVEAYLLLGYSESWIKFLFLIFIFSVIIGLFLGFIKNSPILGFFTFIIFFIFCIIFIFLKASDIKKKLVEQIPSFLQALGNAMQAGYSLPNAFIFISEELDEPLKSEILKINQKLKLQIPLEITLEDFSKNLKNPEVSFFTESTIIQLKIGGNLVILFEKISHMLEEKLKLKRDIKSFTSQGKLSGIMIALLWPLSLMVFSWLSPQHTAVLFETPAGKLLLIISLGLEIIGFFFIWKIISVKI